MVSRSDESVSALSPVACDEVVSELASASRRHVNTTNLFVNETFHSSHIYVSALALHGDSHCLKVLQQRVKQWQGRKS